MQELKETEGFKSWIKGHDPSFIRDLTLTSIKCSYKGRCGHSIPGDIAFANDME